MLSILPGDTVTKAQLRELGYSVVPSMLGICQVGILDFSQDSNGVISGQHCALLAPVNGEYLFLGHCSLESRNNGGLYPQPSAIPTSIRVVPQ